MLNFGRLHSRKGYQAAGLAMTALAIVQASPAFAQDAPAAPQDAQAAPQDNQAAPDPTKGDIVVTGSRIVRSGFQTPQPLTVLTQKEIETQSPTNNLADFVNTLPALAGSTKPANSRLNLSSGQAWTNASVASPPSGPWCSTPTRGWPMRLWPSTAAVLTSFSTSWS